MQDSNSLNAELSEHFSGLKERVNHLRAQQVGVTQSAVINQLATLEFQATGQMVEIAKVLHERIPSI